MLRTRPRLYSGRADIPKRRIHLSPLMGGVPEPVEAEAARLRDAYRRRGPVEAALAGNAGQRLLVAERDRALRSALVTAGRPIGSLLEIGCGEASIVASLVADGTALTGAGIDILPEPIDAGRIAHPGLDLRVGSAAALPYPDASFDAVLAATLFSSIPSGADRAAVLAEVARILRPGGRFVWYDMRRRNPWNQDVRPFNVGEVRDALPGWSIDTRSVTLVPQIARRLGPLARTLYPVLAAVPAFRTHLVGVAAKP